jgi:hypothetical protein
VVGTGLWSQEEADHHAEALLKECGETEDSWRKVYACGFKRFREYGGDVLDLWRRLTNTTGRERKPYSEDMIHAVLGFERVLEGLRGRLFQKKIGVWSKPNWVHQSTM